MFSPDLDTLSSLDRETIDFEVSGVGGHVKRESFSSEEESQLITTASHS